MIVRYLNLKQKPDDISKLLEECGFKKTNGERWEKNDISAVEHNREINGERFYTIRFNVCEMYADSLKEIERLIEVLREKYAHLKI